MKSVNLRTGLWGCLGSAAGLLTVALLAPLLINWVPSHCRGIRRRGGGLGAVLVRAGGDVADGRGVVRRAAAGELAAGGRLPAERQFVSGATGRKGGLTDRDALRQSPCAMTCYCPSID